MAKHFKNLISNKHGFSDKWQLLESNFDEIEPVIKTQEDSKELLAYKTQVKYLTELLADAERDIAKLTQLNQLLKEDIRRQKRYVKREEEAVNFEYLKNVVFKVYNLILKFKWIIFLPIILTM